MDYLNENLFDGAFLVSSVCLLNTLWSVRCCPVLKLCPAQDGAVNILLRLFLKFTFAVYVQFGIILFLCSLQLESMLSIFLFFYFLTGNLLGFLVMGID